MRPQARKFGGMFKKRMNTGGAALYDQKAAEYRKEAESLKSPEVPAAKKQEMRDTVKKMDDAKKAKKAFGQSIMYPETKDVSNYREGGKVKRYAEGGEADDSTMEQALTDSKSFGEAFRAARSGGGKTFTYRGKQYSTELAKPKTSRPAEMKATPSGETDAGAVAGRVSPFARSVRATRGMDSNFRKGGKVKESQMEMRHAKAMKKAGLPKSMVREEMSEAKKYARGGMPMKDGKPAFMQKKMNMGGMAKYARGGGIESRGKTKGTVIKMASGGSVSARADGCAQRGKTKGRML